MRHVFDDELDPADATAGTIIRLPTKAAVTIVPNFMLHSLKAAPQIANHAIGVSSKIYS